MRRHRTTGERLGIGEPIRRVLGPWLTACAAVLIGATTVGTNAAAAQPVSRNFDQQAPAVGEFMPDAVVHDRDGRALSLRAVLDGRHTVLILGCLT